MDKRISYLQEIATLRQEICQKQLQLAEIKSFAERITASWSDMYVSGNSEMRHMEKFVCELDELKQTLLDLSAEYLHIYRTVVNIISQVKNSTYRQLLTYKYLQNKKWDDIAEQMNYDIDGKNIYKIHRKALEAYSQSDSHQHHVTHDERADELSPHQCKLKNKR